ncbi:SGNH/GDSL hydrolase family protein [Sphingomonas sp. LaA6.9]|uniref:SGNH/GDSL hydrolase family protein n=1 Tax=Sphingomonas sp. LaA6.9 TaxID=2919914 RepID=UPI001F4F8EB4|nr:SGNH/GDSL hydrolase family protein [Sphingomonas sp. LaA6.9]MCJ8156434.1 SGNH/GDSL hydrolase family protein [Sphingomonas sp. LaA6.9]
MTNRRFGAIAGAILLATAPSVYAAGQGWTRAWTSSLWQGNERQVIEVDNQTLRFQIRVNGGGSAIRLWLGNDFGRMPVRIGRVTAKSASGRVVPVTFSGQSSTRIAIGAPVVSDPVTLAVKPFELVEIAVHLPEPTTLVGVHVDRANMLHISARGDFTSGEGWAEAGTNELRPLVAGIDVLGTRQRPVVVAFGDSITDATSCSNTAPEPCRWSEVLARRLAAAGKPHVVVNQGIGGNKIITPVAGPNALARFDRDVLSIPNVSHVVLLEGINDIGTSGDTRITAEELIEGYRQLVLRAHAHGIKVIGMTVMPFEGAGYYRPGRDAMREKLNAWIRTPGMVDAVVDMEKVMADPANPRRLRADLQVGDNLHPNDKGQRAMGEAIPLSLFR